MSYTFSEALSAIALEAEKAGGKFPPFNSAHEGYAVLKEEVDELWDEVKKNPTKDPFALSPSDGNRRRIERMHQEAIQVGAMALRFLTDIR